MKVWRAPWRSGGARREGREAAKWGGRQCAGRWTEEEREEAEHPGCKEMVELIKRARWRKVQAMEMGEERLSEWDSKVLEGEGKVRRGKEAWQVTREGGTLVRKGPCPPKETRIWGVMRRRRQEQKQKPHQAAAGHRIPSRWVVCGRSKEMREDSRRGRAREGVTRVACKTGEGQPGWHRTSPSSAEVFARIASQGVGRSDGRDGGEGSR